MQIKEEVGINEETEKYRSDFEDLYFENMAKCKKACKATDCATIADSDSTKNSARASSKISEMINQAFVKLAALQIPQFSGAYTDWASFHDIFSALVHKNEPLSDVQKFFYLRSSLSEDAENVINCLQTTADNYKVARESLTERYDNKKVLVQVHTQSIFDLEPKRIFLSIAPISRRVGRTHEGLRSIRRKPKTVGIIINAFNSI